VDLEIYADFLSGLSSAGHQQLVRNLYFRTSKFQPAVGSMRPARSPTLVSGKVSDAAELIALAERHLYSGGSRQKLTFQ
jgi:hypothetical protein